MRSVLLALCLAVTGCDSSSEPDSKLHAAVALKFHSAPSLPVTAGRNLASVVVVVVDGQNEVMESATPTVTLTVSSSAGGTLLGTTATAAVAGQATYSDLSIQKAGAYSVTASAPGLESATASLLIVSDYCTKLIFTTEPAGAKAGAAMPTFTIACADQYGNPPSIPPGGSMGIALAFGNNPGGATLAGTVSKNGFAAVVSFSDIAIDKSASGYTLVATSTDHPTLTPVSSAAFTITP